MKFDPTFFDRCKLTFKRFSATNKKLNDVRRMDEHSHHRKIKKNIQILHKNGQKKKTKLPIRIWDCDTSIRTIISFTANQFCQTV